MDANITLLSLEKDNKDFFTAQLKLALYEKFGDSIPENYSNSKEWSLLSLIERDCLDHYQLIYTDGKVLCGSGGIIRHHDKKIYQAAFRGFSNHQHRHQGLGLTSYLHGVNTRQQIERAVQLGCDSVVISFNEHNQKLFDTTRKYILPRALREYKFVANDSMTMFNGVPQWLLTLHL